MRKNRKIMQLFSQKNDSTTGSFGKASGCINHSERSEESGRLGFQPNKAAFTLAESGQSPHLRADGGRRCAFTLAEVLITLGIIGVVAAITLPAFMENVNSRVKAKRMENIHQKLSKVTDKMASLDVLQGQGSTENFITEMKNHMSIAKVCKNGELAKCWPTSTIDLGDGKTFEISKATSGKSLKASTEHGEEWDDTMGIVTADGTSMIISYNKNCHYDANTQGLTYDNNTGKSSSLNSGCLAIVYDWNGGSRPNELGKDVIALGGAGGLGTSCAYKLGNLCIREAAHKPAKPMTAAECNAQKSTLGITNCRTSDDDYWGAAVAECGGTSKMFNQAELAQIASEVYGVTVPASVSPGTYTYATFNSEKATALGLPSSASFYVWPGEEYDSYGAYGRAFRSSDTFWGNGHRTSGGNLVLCKGE